VTEFIEVLRRSQSELHTLVLGGIKKLEQRERQKPPLTKIVDEGYGIFELRVGSTNIARVFWFYQPGQRIILTNGYVKKSQKLDSGELATAREYKRDWEAKRG
jgi:phage-related protein